MIETTLDIYNYPVLQQAAYSDTVELGIILVIAFIFIALSYLFSRVGVEYAED